MGFVCMLFGSSLSLYGFIWMYVISRLIFPVGVKLMLLAYCKKAYNIYVLYIKAYKIQPKKKDFHFFSLL